jgi:hypothetical protein
MVDHISKMTDKSKNGRVIATRHVEIKKWPSHSSKNDQATLAHDEILKIADEITKND